MHDAIVLRGTACGRPATLSATFPLMVVALIVVAIIVVTFGAVTLTSKVGALLTELALLHRCAVTAPARRPRLALHKPFEV